MLSYSEACFLSVMPTHHQQLHCLYYVEGDRGHLIRACARPLVNRPYVNRLSRWQPGTCTGDLKLLLAIVRKVVGNTLVLSTSTMKAASGSISKVSQKLDRGEKTKPLCN